jgi:hypothetical protein
VSGCVASFLLGLLVLSILEQGEKPDDTRIYRHMKAVVPNFVEKL